MNKPRDYWILLYGEGEDARPIGSAICRFPSIEVSKENQSEIQVIEKSAADKLAEALTACLACEVNGLFMPKGDLNWCRDLLKEYRGEK